MAFDGDIGSFSTHILLCANLFLQLLCHLNAIATSYNIGAQGRHHKTFSIWN
jgi:hypothetical protein